MIHQIVFGDVVEEFAADVKRPARQRDFDLAVLADVLDAIGEQAGDMRRIGGAAMVTTALASGICEAAANIAAPPRLWPIRIAGLLRVSRKWSAARTRSATLEEKVELAKSPSLEPSPVKSNRNTAMPFAANAAAILSPPARPCRK